MKKDLLYSAFLENVKKHGDEGAVYWESENCRNILTYRNLYNKALTVIKYLGESGIKKGDRIIVALPKSGKQIISILGVLGIGAVYVPINIKQPLSRIKSIIKLSEVNLVITNNETIGIYENIDNITILNIDELDYSMKSDKFVEVSENSSAYIIFTSGTTGQPKGVEISHNSAINTIKDINNRFNVTNKDRILAVSEIDFDLSVYDIFGMLYAGGSMVIVNENDKKEALEWGRYIKEYKITLWNSVPTFFEMLLVAVADKEIIGNLRLILLSGDWVRPKLFTKLREYNDKCRFVALGGATEASIWSNFYEVTEIKDNWTSIPYGQSLSNQTIQVLDENREKSPLNVLGNIYIGGRGLSKGYIGNKELTDEKFIIDKNRNRLYCTGDLGKYIDGECIEFLGRSDRQVKLRGYRIELEEITQALLKNRFINSATTVMVHGDNGNKDYLASAISRSRKKLEIVKLSKINENKLNNIDEAVKDIILDILDLDKYLPCSKENILKENQVIEKAYNICDIWFEWLQNYKCILVKDNVIYKGEFFERKNLTDEGKELYKMISSKKEMMKDILKGKKELFSIIEDDILAPEVISAKNEDVLLCFRKFLNIVKKYCEDIEKPINLLIWNGNNSTLIEKFIKEINNIDVNITISSKHTSITESIAKKLDKFNKNISYVKIEDSYVQEKLISNFDIVVAINSMHTSEDIENDMFKIHEVLKSSGNLISIDMNSLPSISLLTSTFLEDGYKKYNLNNRSENRNPMLSGYQWKQIFIQSGFTNVSNITASLKGQMDIVIAENLSKEDITHKWLDNYLKELIPKYMVPDKYLFMYELPLSKNGKIDNKQITNILSSLSSKIEIVECSTDTERIVRDMWKKIIMIEDVGATQNFFTIGGDSLSATHFITKVKERFDVEITLKDFYDNGVLKDISRIIDEYVENNNFDFEMGEI